MTACHTLAVKAQRYIDTRHRNSITTDEINGSSYKVVSSEVAVTASATLVDLRSGKELWKGVARASTAEQQQNNGGGLAGILITALVNQVLNTLSDRGHEIAGIASQRLLTSNPVNGILPGPRARPISAR